MQFLKFIASQISILKGARGDELNDKRLHQQLHSMPHTLGNFWIWPNCEILGLSHLLLPKAYSEHFTGKGKGRKLSFQGGCQQGGPGPPQYFGGEDW